MIPCTPTIIIDVGCSIVAAGAAVEDPRYLRRYGIRGC
jgi:hypothetical protein